METYKTFDELICALQQGKVITFCNNNIMSSKSIDGQLIKPHHFWCNQQMNRLFIVGDNNKEYEDELSITIIDLIYQFLDGFTDYKEKMKEIERNKVVEMTKEQIEEKLGHKIKIV